MNRKIHLGKWHKILLVATLFMTASTSASSQATNQCADSDLAVQVLGSGGPFGAGRASSGYLIWIDGSARLLIDAGGGTFSNFAASGASVTDLSAIAISHFHPDHSAEVPALLWPRSGSVRLIGPTGSSAYPSASEYVDGLFGDGGVFRDISRRFTVSAVDVDVTTPNQEILKESEFTLHAQGVPHGGVPTLAYRVTVGDVSIAFSSDQNGSDPRFIEFVSGVDLLVIHFAGSEGIIGYFNPLHARPSTWAKMAVDAGVGELMLSHLSANQDFDANLAVLKNIYSGPLLVAEDLMCVSPG